MLTAFSKISEPIAISKSPAGLQQANAEAKFEDGKYIMPSGGSFTVDDVVLYVCSGDVHNKELIESNVCTYVDGPNPLSFAHESPFMDNIELIIKFSTDVQKLSNGDKINGSVKKCVGLMLYLFRCHMMKLFDNFLDSGDATPSLKKKMTDHSIGAVYYMATYVKKETDIVASENVKLAELCEIYDVGKSDSKVNEIREISLSENY